MARIYTFRGIDGACAGGPPRGIGGRGFWIRCLVCAVFALPPCVAAEAPNLFQLLRAEKQIEVPGEDGWNEPYLLPVREIAVGEEVIYTVEFANDGGTEIAQPVVICPLPDFMVYVPGSAIGPGARITFSVDGGNSFAEASELKVSVDGEFETAAVERYTHIRWTLDRPLAPGARGFARFRARRVPLRAEPVS